MVPDELMHSLRPVTVVVGHYGVGKTNFCINLAIDAAEAGLDVTLIDLDIVNPYFRASEQRTVLEQHGVRLVAPVFAEAGSSLDVPSLTGGIAPAIEAAGEGQLVLIDAGGDDVGATALGRFARYVKAHDYAMLYVANRFRNLVADPRDALENMREIEAASHLQVTALASNAHLKQLTTPETVIEGLEYAQELSQLSGLRVVCVTAPQNVQITELDKLYPVHGYVKSPWE